MTVMLATPTGRQAGQMTRRHGVASTRIWAACTSLSLMTVKQGFLIGRQVGRTRRKSGAAQRLDTDVRLLLAATRHANLEVKRTAARIASFGLRGTTLPIKAMRVREHATM